MNMNWAIGWKFKGMDGIDYRVLEADRDKGTYLIAELANFDEDSKYGPLHPQSYTSLCLVHAHDTTRVQIS